MADRAASSAADLRRRFRYFLSDARPRKAARREVASRVRELGWRACVFGGTVRDIAVRGPYSPTRDIDIVVDGVSVDEMADRLGGWVVRRNSFGGLHLNVRGTLFDIWPLHETWALKRWGSGPNSLYSTFQSLPLTTFMSVESVAVSLYPSDRGGREVYEKGFFESVSSRVVELNNPENPYPALCVARAVATAIKLDFRMGPRLVRYVLDQLPEVGAEAVVAAYRRHYRSSLFSAEELETLGKRLSEAAIRDPATPLAVPLPRQLDWGWASLDPIESAWIADPEFFGFPAGAD